MRLVILAIAALAAITLAGCGGVATRNQEAHQQYVELVGKREAAQRADDADTAAKRAQDYAAIAAKCTDSACVQNVAAFKTITDVVHDAMAGGRASAAAAIPPPPYERDGAAKFRDIVSGATPLLSTVANAWVNVRQSDNAVRTSEAQYQFLSSTVGSMADVAQGAQPDITVGGDYVTGTQRIGDEHNGDTVGRDLTGGDHVDVADSTVDSYNGDNRDNCTTGNGAAGGVGGEGDESSGAPGGAGGSCGG